MEELSKNLIHAMFTNGGGTEACNPLVRHQIESYNDFLDKKLSQVVHGFNPVVVCGNFRPELKDFANKVSLTILHPTLGKPIFQSQDGSSHVMTPHLARMNNLTYASNLYIDIHVIHEEVNADGVTERSECRIPRVCIGKVPIMVKSKACSLQCMQGLSDGQGNVGAGKQECRYDPGGYFVINGNEKVVISQDRISENKTLVFAPSGNSDGMQAEIRSIPDGVFMPPKTTTLHLAGKPNHLGRTIRLTASFLRNEIPLFVMFRALGVLSDRDILTHITLGEDTKNKRLISELAACAEDACDVHTQEEALTQLLRVFSVSGTPREYLENPEQAQAILKNVIAQDFMPHVGRSFRKKALYLGYMVRKLLRIHFGYALPDNRDSYVNKRIDTPGILYANLFRQCYGKLIKDVRNMIQREMHLWRATSTQTVMQIITPTNVHRFFKTTVLETGLRYALSTGNWGVKTVGSYANIRQGVAQVLNRLTYLSSMSHLRRVNTPMEKSGKLVQPRKLDNTQFGMVCPAETPEGASVGLVKNMSMSTHITTHMSSVMVRTILRDYGVVHMDDAENVQDFLMEMGKPHSVQIQVNGDLIGYHADPNMLHKELRKKKRMGIIPPTTAIIWDVQGNIMAISTEAGRMCRPLYVVDGGNTIRAVASTSSMTIANTPTYEFFAPVDKMEEGFLEYLDVEEIDRSMVAMFPKDLTLVEGLRVKPNYTHCEIHPSLMLGVLAANIPFMEHNQAPRNCYQSAMGKQAVGVYMSNFNQRMDTVGHVLNYPQRPLAKTMLSKYTNCEELPSGINAVVAIMTYSGFNQEDSVMINKGALDRGLYSSTYLKTLRDQCSKNHSTGEEEMFCMPQDYISVEDKPSNYNKVAEDGFVPKNTYVDSNDILVGKVMPHKQQGNMLYRDTSMHMKNNDSGMVDMNYIGTNGEGYKFAKVRLRGYRKPVVGDKLASRSAQKGTVGQIYMQQDMPFTKDGIVPDIIMNPHAIPSRMTIGQLMECIMGKAGAMLGMQGDATPFNECSVEDISSVLGKFGMERYGNEILYNGRTGEQIKTEIFIGPTFYQRLKHMVVDKMHVRSSNGPVVMLTRQPAEGRARNGGLRFGEMERDCLAEDHQILTNQGFKFLHELEKLEAEQKENKNVEQLLYASYDQATKEIVYEKANELIIKPAKKQKMIEVTHHANNVSLLVTPKHDMFMQSGSCTEHKVTWKTDFQKVKADSLLENDETIVCRLISIADNAPSSQYVLQNSRDIKEVDYEGRTWCASMPHGFIIARRAVDVDDNGQVVKASVPVIMGNCIIGHGAASFLKERMMDVSDNYRIFVCKKCGMLCHANPEKNIFKCATCKNTADINQVRIPYSCKLLFQELEAMNIATRIMT